MDRLEKYRGHLMNWYDTHTLQPKPPFFISSVDNGNMVASSGLCSRAVSIDCTGPCSRSWQRVTDYLRVLVGLRALPKRVLSDYETSIHKSGWLQAILNFPENVLREEKRRTKPELASDIAWFRGQAEARIKNVREIVQAYMPWALPQFADLRAKFLERSRITKFLCSGCQI